MLRAEVMATPSIGWRGLLAGAAILTGVVTAVVAVTARDSGVRGVASAPTGRSDCGEVVGEVYPTSTISEVKAALVGKIWQRCRGRALGPSDQDGIELATDGRFFYLHEQAGKLVRGDGAAYTGRFEILDTSSMNGPGAFQLNLNHDYPAGTGQIASIRLYKSAGQLSLSETGGDHLYAAK